MNRYFIVILLIFVLLLPGCATMGDKVKTKTQAILIGTPVIGIAGALATRDPRARLIIIILGAAVSYKIGEEIANRKAEYVSREDFLAAEIQMVSECNKATKDYNSQLRAEIAQFASEVEILRSKHADEETRQEQIALKRTELEERLQINSVLEQRLSKELEIQIAILDQERIPGSDDDSHIAKLEAEISELKSNIEELREGSIQLAAINERLLL